MFNNLISNLLFLLQNILLYYLGLIINIFQKKKKTNKKIEKLEKNSTAKTKFQYKLFVFKTFAQHIKKINQEQKINFFFFCFPLGFSFAFIFFYINFCFFFFQIKAFQIVKHDALNDIFLESEISD